MLLHIPQRSKVDCAVASVAMMANVKYEEALETSAGFLGPRGMTHPATLYLLISLTGVLWQQPKFTWYQRVSRLAAADVSQLLFICSFISFWKFHCIAVQGEWIHDPDYPRGFKIRNYPRRNWRAYLAFHPANQDSLAKARQLRWPELYESLEFGGGDVNVPEGA